LAEPHSGGHTALACEHGALVPPPEPLQVQVRVVLHAVAALSLTGLPVVHAPFVPHTPFTTGGGGGGEEHVASAVHWVW
jgi:hypothetical protein